MNLSGLTTGNEGGTRVSGDARRLREIRFFSSVHCPVEKEKKYLLIHLSRLTKLSQGI